MDWFLDRSDPIALSELRHQLGDYLRRHSAPGADVGGAEVAFSELLTNAIRHTDSPVWVSVHWGGQRPRVTIHDLGPGFELDASLPTDPLQPGGRGLYMAAHLAQELSVAAKRAGGSKVSAVLPVWRRREPSHLPSPRPRTGQLPAASEARADGTFGRESFLRALVVQLAQAVEQRHGPDDIESTVAQVGTDVGSRMEAEYRRADDVVGRLTPDQMSELYVRLKRALDGDFYVVEADDDKIVLGNRRCPFGDAVKRAPQLCQMTSSVFGGIAARNRGEATVVLEERIAVGDPECRVVVWLTEPPADHAEIGHRYLAPRVPEPA